jgi:uncharacterized membrane protein YeaQ/YmgE (transglycosylase-associated protein family)
MGILLWIIFGIIVGAVARMFVPEGPGGLLGDLVVGVIGALLGGWIYGLFGHVGVTGFNIWSFVCAVVGSIALLLIIRLFSGTRTVA